MALDTYANLQTAIAGWLNRSDLTAAITADFIPAFEMRARRELRKWLRGTVVRTNVSTETAFNATENVESVIGAYLSDGANGTQNAPLGKVTREEFQRLMAEDATTGRTPVLFYYPEYDAVADTITIRYYPPVSAANAISSVTFDVMHRLPAIASAVGNTNALFAFAPDLYLYGALIEAAMYIDDAARIDLWESRVVKGFQQLELLAEKKEFDGNPITPALSRVFG